MQWAKLVPELTVFDFEKSLEFYTNILGFKLAFGRPEENFAYLDQEGVQFMLEQFHQDGWNIGTLEPPLGRGINYQIELEDTEPIHQRLKKSTILFTVIAKMSGEKQGMSSQVSVNFCFKTLMFIRYALRSIYGKGRFILICLGASRCVASSRAVLDECLRRLPEIARNCNGFLFIKEA